MTTRPTPAVGQLVRQWRDRRRVSQLALASEAAVSTRHLSFVETGRSKPSRDLVLRLSEHLDIPLRSRNELLLAAGFAPVYPEHDLAAPHMVTARAAVRTVLDAHHPYPALAVDRTWNIVDSNAAVQVLTEGVCPQLLAQRPLNALRLTLHPQGMASRIRNLSQWRTFALTSLHRDAVARADTDMLSLHDELADYPLDCQPCSTESNAVYVPFELTVDGAELSFLTIITTFGTAVEVTLSELAIESFLPADDATAAYLRSHAG